MTVPFPAGDIVTLGILWRPFALAFGCAAAFALLFSLAAGRRRFAAAVRGNFPQLLAFSLPVVVLGYISGYLTGISRAPAVGNLVPAILSLVGGVGIYVFGTETRFKGIVGYCVMMFAVALLYGTGIGALQNQLGFEERMKLLSDQERRIRNFRYNLDLDEQPPGWIVPGGKDKP